MQIIHHSQPGHDEVLVARLAAADLVASETVRARALVADCPACAALLGDLHAITQATATLPAPRRPRDFRLTEADAARLRPAGWRGLLRAFGQPRLAFAGPLATGLAALGIGGLLVASLSGGLAGTAGATGAAYAPAPTGAAYAPAPEQQYSSRAAAPTTAGPGSADASAAAAGSGPSVAPDVAAGPGPSLAASLNPISGFAAVPSNRAAPLSSPGTLTSGQADARSAASAAPSDLRMSTATGNPSPSLSSGPSQLLLGSGLVLLVGLALGALRLVGRRLA